MKLCVIYNFEQRYREGIYKLIDQRWHPHWVFGNNKSDIKGLRGGVLNDVEHIHNLFLGPLYWQAGAVSQLKRHDTLLMLGELFCVSTWAILLLRHTVYKDKRVFLWSHGWYGREGWLKRMLKRWFFALSDATFLYGQYALDTARQQGYKKGNLLVIHNSLDYDTQVKLRKELTPDDIYRKHFGNDCPTLLFIGRLTRIKRLDILLTSLQLLRDEGKMYNLILVGDGEDKERLQGITNQYGLDQQVWFYGASYDERSNARLIYNADLCVAPGNVGLTAVHSMTYGTPVITHDNKAWQMPEFEAIKENITGNFFHKDSHTSLAKCIDRWFSEHGNRREQVRQWCESEIDEHWTPQYQMNVLSKKLE